MALTVNPATKVFTILQADLSAVSGTLFELDTAQFKLDVMELLASEKYIWMDFPYAHNGEVTVVGTTFARVLELINNYSITFEDTLSAYSIRLANSNNNLFDVDSGILNPTDKVTVIGQNAAGLIVVASGSGLSAGEQAELSRIDLATIYHSKIIDNFKELIKIANVWYLIIYDDGEVSGGTEILRKPLKDSSNNDITDLVAGVLASELESTA